MDNSDIIDLNLNLGLNVSNTSNSYSDSTIAEQNQENVDELLTYITDICSIDRNEPVNLHNWTNSMTENNDEPDLNTLAAILNEKEKDLELAAKIGKSLLERNKELQLTNDYLEEQINSANDQVTQLKHELQQKIDLLHAYNEINQESDSGGSTPASDRRLSTWNNLQKKLELVEEENLGLKLEINHLKTLTENLENKENQLITDCLKQIADANFQINQLTIKLNEKLELCAAQESHLEQCRRDLVEKTTLAKKLEYENEELTLHLLAAQETQKELAQELIDLQDRYAEVIAMLSETRGELKLTRENGGGALGYSGHVMCCNFYDSLASELEASDAGYSSFTSSSDTQRNKRPNDIPKTKTCSNNDILPKTRDDYAQTIPTSSDLSVNYANLADLHNRDTVVNRDIVATTSDNFADFPKNENLHKTLTSSPVNVNRTYVEIPKLKGINELNLHNSEKCDDIFTTLPTNGNGPLPLDVWKFQQQKHNDIPTTAGGGIISTRISSRSDSSESLNNMESLGFGIPGVPGSKDLDNAIKRLSLRKRVESAFQKYKNSRRPMYGGGHVTPRATMMTSSNNMTSYLNNVTSSPRVDYFLFSNTHGSTFNNVPFVCQSQSDLPITSTTTYYAFLTTTSSTSSPARDSDTKRSDWSKQFDHVTSEKRCSDWSAPNNGGGTDHATAVQSTNSKLMLVKPMEGSMTLAHWRRLATPTFDNAWAKRHGIKVKGGSPPISAVRSTADGHVTHFTYGSNPVTVSTVIEVDSAQSHANKDLDSGFGSDMETTNVNWSNVNWHRVNSNSFATPGTFTFITSNVLHPSSADDYYCVTISGSRRENMMTSSPVTCQSTTSIFPVAAANQNSAAKYANSGDGAGTCTFSTALNLAQELKERCCEYFLSSWNRQQQRRSSPMISSLSDADATQRYPSSRQGATISDDLLDFLNGDFSEHDILTNENDAQVSNTLSNTELRKQERYLPNAESSATTVSAGCKPQKIGLETLLEEKSDKPSSPSNLHTRGIISRSDIGKFKK